MRLAKHLLLFLLAVAAGWVIGWLFYHKLIVSFL